jgi:hypothetical protein
MLDAAINTQTGLLNRVADWVVARMRAANERTALTRGDIHEMAHDLGLCEDDLRGVLLRAPDNTGLMDGMTRARGLDPMLVSQMSAAVMRDLELTRTRCGSVGRCKHELGAGTAAAHYDSFCANADTFDALLDQGAAPDRLTGGLVATSGRTCRAVPLPAAPRRAMTVPVSGGTGHGQREK